MKRFFKLFIKMGQERNQVILKVVLAFLIISATGLFGYQAYDLWLIQQGRFLDDKKLQVVYQPVKQSSLSGVIAMHLFGDVSKAPTKEVAVEQKNLPVTDLKLELKGAMTSTSESAASAFISSNNQTKRYYINDSIPGGAILHAVNHDSVVLKRGERLETLNFPKHADIAQQSVERLMSASPAYQQQVAPVPTQQPQPQMQQAPGQTAGPQGLSLQDRLKRSQSLRRKPSSNKK